MTESNIITISDLPEGLREIAQAFGEDRLPEFLDVLWSLQGDRISIPKKIFKHIRNQKIKKEFTGQNHRELAIKYNLKPLQIYRILSN